MIHIVPTVPPAINGLADYCYKLWQHWPQPRPSWTCLVAKLPPEAQKAWPEAEISAFETSGNGLKNALQNVRDDTIVLHYVGYAYHSKGVPTWLPGALRDWKARSPENRLFLMFHELWATGKPNGSAFWLSPMSRRIAVQLARDCDGWVTSCEAASLKLITQAGADASRGRVLPIGPGIEPPQAVDWTRPWPLSASDGARRKLRVAVFGLSLSRLMTLRAHANLLRELCRRDLVERMSMIGKADEPAAKAQLSTLQADIAPPETHPDLWQVHGNLTPEQLSSVLMEHDLGVTHYSPSLLTKSSVFAALCAHGLIVVSGAETVLGRVDASNVPHISNDDARPEATNAVLTQLCDAHQMADLQAQTRDAAQNLLSWSGITRAWADLIAERAPAKP